jgi:hypothetical protein
MSLKNVLFVSYGGGHATMVAPVVKALKNDNFNIQVLGLTMAGQTFSREQIPYLGFQDFLNLNDHEALKIGQELAKKMHADHTGIPLQESIAYLGLSYMDLVGRVGRVEAEKQFAEIGRQAFCPISILERVFDRIMPDVLVTTNSPRAEEAARIVANRRGVPVVVLTDLLGDDSENLFPRPMNVKHLCTTCETALNRYKKSRIVNAEQYHLVGNPAIDRAMQFRDSVDVQLRDQMFPAWRDGAKYVMFAETAGFICKSNRKFVHWQPNQIIDHLSSIYEACQKLNAVLLIRPHPSLSPDLFMEWVKKQSSQTVYMVNKTDIYLLFQFMDLFIANLSTTMLEALYMKKPLLIPHFTNSMTILPFDEMGFAFATLFDNQLVADMSRALTDLEALEIMHQRFNAEFPQLPCAPRIAQIIRNECSNKNT